MSRFIDTCKKCGNKIDGDSLYCKHCGVEHILDKPETLKEIANKQGIDNPIHISWKKEFLEEYDERWKRYDSQQAKLKAMHPDKNLKLKNFFKEVHVKNLGLFIIGVMLLIAIFDLPYFYYRLLRVVVCVFSFYIGLSNNVATVVRIFLFICVILFNPFEPISFDKNIWMIIDIILAAIYLGISMFDHFKIMQLTTRKEG